MRATRALLSLVILIAVSHAVRAEWEVSGSLGPEIRWFPREEADQRQHCCGNLSFSLQPEFYKEWDDGDQSLLFVPFFRLDQGDGARTHFDIRELTWLKAGYSWELRLGIRKDFWGVVESQHLVDTINQSDFIENIDTEDKLGQPMVNLALIRDWGTVDLFVLPYFRERTFASNEGRLRTRPGVATDLVEYESSAEEHHVDFAVRWSHAIGDWDLGLSHFYGTSRAPRLLPHVVPTGELVLIPYYDIINQTGLDVQATKGDWLWKLEVIRRSGQADTFVAMTGGFEYTFIGIFDTLMDLGVLTEYLYDDRGERGAVPFQDDILTGMRLSVNDAQSTTALFGVMIDRDDRAWSMNLEASRRFGNRWTVELEARFFENLDAGNAQSAFKDDDYVQIQIFRYF